MKKKYFFFDYDGTLTIGATGQVTESARRAIRMLEDRGHFVAVATGRLQCDALERCRNIGIENLVSDGGNGLTMDGRLIYLNSLNIQHSITLLDELEQKGISWAVINENSKVRYSKTEQFTREVKDTYIKTIIEPDMDYRQLKQLYKIFISCDPEREKGIYALEPLPKVRYNPICLFIEPDDKQLGIMKMAQLINAPKEDIVVFGDGMNDIKMFKEDWTSIAMGNARDALKQIADFVTRGSDEDGIEYACRHFGWI